MIGTGIAIVGLFNTPCHNIGWHRLCLMLSICLLFYSFISLFIFFMKGEESGVFFLASSMLFNNIAVISV